MTEPLIALIAVIATGITIAYFCYRKGYKDGMKRGIDITIKELFGYEQAQEASVKYTDENFDNTLN